MLVYFTGNIFGLSDDRKIFSFIISALVLQLSLTASARIMEQNSRWRHFNHRAQILGTTIINRTLSSLS